IPAAAVGTMRCQQGNRAVTPIVVQRLAGDRVVGAALRGIEFLHGQQLDCSNSEVLQIRNLFDESAEGARKLHLGTRVRGQAADVSLINDGLVPRVPRRSVIAPVESLTCEDALR